MVDIRKDQRTGLLQVVPKSQRASASQCAQKVLPKSVRVSAPAALQSAPSASSKIKLPSSDILCTPFADTVVAPSASSMLTQQGSHTEGSSGAAAATTADPAGDGERLMAEAVQMTQTQALPSTSTESLATTAASGEDPDVWFEVTSRFSHNGSSLHALFPLRQYSITGWSSESEATATHFSSIGHGQRLFRQMVHLVGGPLKDSHQCRPPECYVSLL